MTNKNIIIGAIVALLVGFAIGWVSNTSQSVGGIQPVGTTFSTAKVASVIMVPATDSASSTSILNTDATDRIFVSSFAACNTVGTSLSYLVGAGIVDWRVRMATTSAGTQTGSVNYVSNMAVSTSTPWAYSASSTAPFPNASAYVWPTNTYLTITFNATNTASCLAGVNYLAS